MYQGGEGGARWIMGPMYWVGGWRVGRGPVSAPAGHTATQVCHICTCYAALQL